MVSRLFVYSELVGEVASLATEALSGHRLRTSRQLKAKQPRCLLARPNMVTCSLPWKGWPRWCLPAGAHRARPLAESLIAAALRAPGLGTRPGEKARHPGPALPRSGPLTRAPAAAPSLVSVHKSQIKQARATFPLIPPRVRGKLKGMQSQGSAGGVSTTRRSGRGAPSPLALQSAPRARGFLVPGWKEEEEEGEGREGVGRLGPGRSCIIQQLSFRARLFPGSGSLLQTLFMGQSGIRGGRAVCFSASPRSASA